MFCKHKWSEKQIANTIIMTCEKCGKIKIIKIECDHQWEKIEDYEIPSKLEEMKKIGLYPKAVLPYILTKQRIQIFKCKKCGIEETHKVEI